MEAEEDISVEQMMSPHQGQVSRTKQRNSWSLHSDFQAYQGRIDGAELAELPEGQKSNTSVLWDGARTGQSHVWRLGHLEVERPSSLGLQDQRNHTHICWHAVLLVLLNLAARDISRKEKLFLWFTIFPSLCFLFNIVIDLILFRPTAANAPPFGSGR